MSPSLCSGAVNGKTTGTVPKKEHLSKESTTAATGPPIEAHSADADVACSPPADCAAAMPLPPPSPSVPPRASAPLHLPPSDCAPSTGAAAAAVDWSRVRLGVDAAPSMFVANWSPDTGRWDGGELVPYGPLSLLPAAQVLNYGQSIFEGMKAYRHDGDSAAGAGAGIVGSGGGRDRVLLFRPDANAARFAAGAVRMCMPAVPPAMFLAAVQAVVRANAAWVPPPSRGSLYLRPLLLGTGPLLGLCPAPSYTFVVYAVPVGGRAKEGRLTALDFLIHDSLHRAAPRGVGSTKAAGNYSPCLKAQAEARAVGCHDCIYLDARSDTYLEEGSGCNVFVIHGSVLTTPPAAGSILPGITRHSLLQLAAALGYTVREAGIKVADAMRADEMFASGTAVVVQPIGSVTFKGRRVQFSRGGGGGGNVGGTVAEPMPAANGRPAAGGGRNGGGAGAPDSSSSCDSSSSEVGPEEAEAVEEDAGAGADGEVCAFGDGKSAAELLPQERTALAAMAPVPEPGSLPPGVGPLTQRLYSLLTGIQYGRVPDVFGWMLEVDMAGPTAGPLDLDQLQQCDDEVGAEAVSEQLGGLSCQAAAAKGGKGSTAPPARTVFADPNLE